MRKKNMIEYLIPIGILFVFLGIMIIFAGSMLLAGSSGKDKGTGSKVHVGIGGFIGPIPFGFANSRTMLYVVVGLAAFTLIVWLVLRYAL